MLLPPNLNVRLSNGPVHERVRGLGRRRKAFSGQFTLYVPELVSAAPEELTRTRVSVCTGLCDRNGVDDVAIHPRPLHRRFVFVSALSFSRSAGGTETELSCVHAALFLWNGCIYLVMDKQFCTRC